MQSFLAYRRFGNQLRRQIQRHGTDGIAGDASSQPDVTMTDDPDAAVEPNSRETADFGEEDASTAPPPEEKQDIDDETLSTAHTRDPSTLERMGTRLGISLTGIDVRTRTAKEGGKDGGKIFVVGYSGPNDSMNPHNWSYARRSCCTVLVGMSAFIVGFASSCDSAAIQQARQDFGVSEVAESLATGLYLIGFGIGAFFAAPLSETVGRNPIYILTTLLFMIFIMASALAPNIGAQLTFRFLAGVAGSTPLTTAGGSISDMWTPAQRSAVFPFFATCGFWGPVFGPVIGGWIGQSSIISWRWTEWITLIWAAVIFVPMLLFLPETYGPTLLTWKASHLRKITGDSRYVSELEIREIKFLQRMLHNIYRPFVIFVYEPIVVLFTLYLTIVYIVLFTFLTGYEFIFGQVFGLSQGLTFLCFLGLSVGFSCATAIVPFIYKKYKRDLEKMMKETGHGLPPEERLWFSMIGAPFLPIGLFWMGWTAFPSIGPWPALISSVLTGFGILGIFISTYQYLIDAFELHAASALVMCTFVRYVVAGGMIEVSIPMYKNLGVHWTLTLLACISLIMVPVPFLFYRYGSLIRSRSRYAKS